MCKHTTDGHICKSCYYEYHESKEDLRRGDRQPENDDEVVEDEDSYNEDDL